MDTNLTVEETIKGQHSLDEEAGKIIRDHYYLIEKHRDINVTSLWWAEDVENDFVDSVGEYGIVVHDDSINWTGFYTQSDGASFGGHMIVTESYVRENLDASKYPALLKYLAEAAVNGWEFWLYIRNPKSVSHYTGMYVEATYPSYHYIHGHPMEGLKLAVADALDSQLEEEVMEFEEDMTHVVRDLARDLYVQLRDEYEYQTSDKVVAEAIISCDLYHSEIEEAA